MIIRVRAIQGLYRQRKIAGDSGRQRGNSGRQRETEGDRVIQVRVIMVIMVRVI
jgi:hypothetical protein